MPNLMLNEEETEFVLKAIESFNTNDSRELIIQGDLSYYIAKYR